MAEYRMILIDPETETITEHQLSDAYQGMVALIGEPDTIDTFRIADHGGTFDYGYVDDKGLSRGEPIHAFQFIGRDDPVAGKCLIYGCEKHTGETCDAQFPLSTLTGLVRWLGKIVPEVTWTKNGLVDQATVSWRKVQ